MSIRLSAATYLGERLAKRTGREGPKIIYGLWALFTIIATIVLLALAKLVLQQIVRFSIPIFTVYISFSLLRYFLGGIHLENTRACLFVTVALIALTGYVSNSINISAFSIIAIYVIGIFVTYYVGVVDCEQKRLKETRKARYRRIGLALTFVYFAVNLCLYKSYTSISNAIALGSFLEYLNQIASIWSSRYKQKSE